MKTIAVLLFACCAVSLSCKKQVPEKVWRGTFTATVDSLPTTFAFRLEVDNYYSSISGNHNLRITAYREQGGDQFEVLASDTTTVTTGSYSENGSTNTRTARLTYDEKGRTLPFMSSNSGTNPTTIIVDVLQDDRVQGSFSGDVYLLNYTSPNFVATATKKVITNGTFDVRLQ